MAKAGKKIPSHSRGARIFSHLGDFVTRRPKAVLAIWIILLVAAIPLVMRLSEVTSPGSMEFSAGDAESTRAQKLIAEQFPRAVANSSAIIVLQGHDVTDGATKQFVLGMEERLLANGILQDFEGFTSVYSVQRVAIAEGTREIAPLLYQTNFTAFLVYGIPATYLGQWQDTNTSWSIAERDRAANVSTTLLLTSLADSQSFNITTRSILLGYYSLFFRSWSSTATNASIVVNPLLRAQLAVDASIPLFTFSIPDPAFAGFLRGVWKFFNLATWREKDAIYAFVNLQLTAFGGKPLPPDFLDAVSALGPNPTPSAIYAVAKSVVASGSLRSYPFGLPPDLLQRFVNEANDTMIVVVSFSKTPRGFGSVEDDPIAQNVRKIRDIGFDLKASVGAPERLFVTGNAAIALDSSVGAAQDFARIEPVTIASLILLVSVFFLSLVASLVPLGGIFAALMLAQGGTFLIGTFIVKIPDTVLTFLFPVILGVGVDYAIFLIARYREERLEGIERLEAVRTSVTWAGESIATSGATVIIAFSVLSIGSFGMIRAIGLSVGIGVLIALIVSLTLIPAVLALLGNRIFWPTNKTRFQNFRKRVNERRAGGHRNYFHQAATFSVRHAKAVLLVVVLISIPTTFISLTGATSFDFIGGLPTAESSRGLKAMQQGFGEGQLGPTFITVQFPNPILVGGNLTPEAQGALEILSTRVATLDNVKSVTGPTRPNGSPVDATNLTALDLSQRLAVLGAIGKDHNTVLVTVISVESPFARTSVSMVDTLRGLVKDLEATHPSLGQATILVGGQSAITNDFAAQINSEFRTMELIVVVAIFIVLLLVLGSYLLPVAAILSIALSITWAYAATLLFFNNLLQAEVLFMIPLILFILLMGIGMDYNIFILTRIREEAQKGKNPSSAAIDAVDRTGGIITALALILAASLGSLMLSSNRLLQGFGFAIAVAVLLDAMVVRTYLVPAVMAVLGNRAWWGPRALRRVDVEQS